MRDPVYRLVNGLGRAALRAMAVDVRWTGVEHVPRTGPVVLAATHGSFPDFVLVERAAVTRGRHVRFLVRYDVWHTRGVSWWLDQMGHVPVDRSAPVHAYLRARELLLAGEAVCGFPEAGVSHSYTVRPLMPGLVALAAETGAPLLPVALWGAQRIFSVGDPKPPIDWTRGRRVDVAFGAPVHVARDADPVVGTQALGHRLTELLEGLQRLPHHQPRGRERAPWHPAHLGGDAPDRRRALALDRVPPSAVRPTWGPDPAAYDGEPRGGAGGGDR